MNSFRSIERFSVDLRNSFATCLLFVSSANAMKDKKQQVAFSQTVRFSSYKGIADCSCSACTVSWRANVLVQNLVRSTNQNQNMTSNEFVPKSNQMARAFAECPHNQSKLQKLGSRLPNEPGTPVFVSRSNINRSNWACAHTYMSIPRLLHTYFSKHCLASSRGSVE